MLTIAVCPIKVESGTPPVVDLDVIVWLDDGTSTLGAFYPDEWVDVVGQPFEHCGRHVVAWAPFPSLGVAVEIA